MFPLQIVSDIAIISGSLAMLYSILLLNNLVNQLTLLKGKFQSKSVNNLIKSLIYLFTESETSDLLEEIVIFYNMYKEYEVKRKIIEEVSNRSKKVISDIEDVLKKAKDVYVVDDDIKKIRLDLKVLKLGVISVIIADLVLIAMKLIGIQAEYIFLVYVSMAYGLAIIIAFLVLIALKRRRLMKKVSEINDK
jgi:hypothetical protein